MESDEEIAEAIQGILWRTIEEVAWMRARIEEVWAERAYLLTVPWLRGRIHWVDDGSIEPRGLACWLEDR